jgi:hypothetical protein
MRSTSIACSALGLALLGLIGPAPISAQDTSPAHTHIGHVADGFRGTPDRQGLLPTAVAEAEIALRHATLAAGDASDLEGMQRHVGHVARALDASTSESGPGLGYGVLAAAGRAAQHISLAARSEGASDGAKTHATHVSTAANNAVSNAEAALELASQIQEATEASEAAELLEELTALCDAILNGVDANEDGRTGWQEGEGGLAQATQHLTLLMRGEGLGG